MSDISISDGLVDQVTLYTSLPWVLRWDVAPFVVAYAISFCFILSDVLYYKYIGFTAMPTFFTIHLFLFLVSQWSVLVKCMIGFKKVKVQSKATHLHVSAAKHSGKDNLLQLEMSVDKASHSIFTVVGKEFRVSDDKFLFQKVMYQYDSSSNSYARLTHPSRAPMNTFLSWKGYADSSQVEGGQRHWGKNEFDIPIPNFLDLYLVSLIYTGDHCTQCSSCALVQDHLVAPFFLFQVLCLFLWSLDDYWYYSAFTLVMLMFFEGMMCRQRQSSLAMLRNMRRPPVPLFVHRHGQWGLLSSDLLLPGDLVSLSSQDPLHSAGAAVLSRSICT